MFQKTKCNQGEKNPLKIKPCIQQCSCLFPILDIIYLQIRAVLAFELFLCKLRLPRFELGYPQSSQHFLGKDTYCWSKRSYSNNCQAAVSIFLCNVNMQPREIPITINFFLSFLFHLFNQMPKIPTIHNRKNSKGTCNPMKCGENDIVKTRSPINLKNEELDNLKEESTKIRAYSTFRFTSDIGGELTSSIIATFIS